MAGSVTSAGRSASATSSMTMLFERFNEKALKSVLAAQEQSKRMGQTQVGATWMVGIVDGPGGFS